MSLKEKLQQIANDEESPIREYVVWFRDNRVPAIGAFVVTFAFLIAAIVLTAIFALSY